MTEGAAAAPRIGVLGGTFDPPHAGHLAMARAAVERLGLDRLLLVVANDPWQKTAEAPVSPAADRLAMVEALAAEVQRAGRARVEVDDREVRRGGPSYMADTLAELAAEHSGAELVLLVGSDVAPLLDTWVRPAEVRDRANIVVVRRAGRSSEQGAVPPGWEATVLEADLPEVSSSAVRAMYGSGGEAAAQAARLVPAGVDEEVRRRGLYR